MYGVNCVLVGRSEARGRYTSDCSPAVPLRLPARPPRTAFAARSTFNPLMNVRKAKRPNLSRRSLHHLAGALSPICTCTHDGCNSLRLCPPLVSHMIMTPSVCKPGEVQALATVSECAMQWTRRTAMKGKDACVLSNARVTISKLYC